MLKPKVEGPAIAKWPMTDPLSEHATGPLTPYAEVAGQAWTLNLFNGAVNFRNSNNSFYARTVRGGR